MSEFDGRELSERDLAAIIDALETLIADREDRTLLSRAEGDDGMAAWWESERQRFQSLATRVERVRLSR